jgi:hypothetical protein
MILSCDNPLVEKFLSGQAIPAKSWWQGNGGSNELHSDYKSARAREKGECFYYNYQHYEK